MTIDIDPGDSLLPEPVGFKPKFKLFELQFTFGNRDKTPDMFALVSAPDGASALRTLMSMWQPPAEISNMQIREVKKYFQILTD